MNIRTITGLGGMLALNAIASAQTDLDLTYTESSVGAGLYSYNMTLSINQSQGAWAPGMGWGWIIFGDALNSPSPIADFTLTSAVPAPFSRLSSTQGTNNGPSWISSSQSLFAYWVPASASSTLTWAGTSSYDASTQGPLYFSELANTGGSGYDYFKQMQPAATPEPTSMLGLAGASALLLRRRKKNSQRCS